MPIPADGVGNLFALGEFVVEGSFFPSPQNNVAERDDSADDVDGVDGG